MLNIRSFCKTVFLKNYINSAKRNLKKEFGWNGADPWKTVCFVR